jgi:hypothetical protein
MPVEIIGEVGTPGAEREWIVAEAKLVVRHLIKYADHPRLPARRSRKQKSNKRIVLSTECRLRPFAHAQCPAGHRKFRTVHASLTTVTATLIVALGLTISGCGGYSSAKRPDRGTTSIKITAQAGTTSHTTTVSVTVQ